MTDSKIAIFGTQGGGLVTEKDGKYIFVAKPKCPGFKIGDEMPAEWGTVPANSFAREEVEAEQFGSSLDERWLILKALSEKLSEDDC